ncbi:MAG: hypothetical protein R2711_13640 [Acidimicrobiales bacterium]
MSAADADVVESAAVAQGELAELVDDVVADPVVGVVEGGPGRDGFGSGGERRLGASTEGPVGRTVL